MLTLLRCWWPQPLTPNTLALSATSVGGAEPDGARLLGPVHLPGEPARVGGVTRAPAIKPRSPTWKEATPDEAEHSSSHAWLHTRLTAPAAVNANVIDIVNQFITLLHKTPKTPVILDWIPIPAVNARRCSIKNVGWFVVL